MQSFSYLIQELVDLSQVRSKLVTTGATASQIEQTEESKHDSTPDIYGTFNLLSRQVLHLYYSSELYQAFSKAKAQETELKLKAEAAS